LEAILCTEELSRRPSRPPDYETEHRALAALVQALADSPGTILQTLADTILTIFGADSAGLSLLTKDETRFYWPAIAGAWQPHIGGGTPRNFGPCGDVLDRNAPQLFTHWERRYPYLHAAHPAAEEGLLVPFYVKGKAVGTIWAIMHDTRRKFDAEDLRQLESLGRFASAAYQAVTVLDEVEQQGRALRQTHTELEKRLAELHQAEDSRRAAVTSMEERTQELVQSQERLRALAIKLSRAEDRERKRLATAIHEDLSQLLALAKMKLERLDVHQGRADVRPALTVVKGLLNESLTVARTLTADLRPPLLGGTDDLMAALRWVVDKMHRHGLTVTVTEHGESKVLEEDILLVTYQAVQELLWNVLKHAQTGEATICVDRRGEQAEIIIEDRGQGFDSTRMTTPSKEGGFGLLNISERVSSVGGHFTITSAPGAGTRAQIIVPMKATHGDKSSRKAELQDSRSRGEEPSETIDRARMQVLVVDDHPLMREAVRHLVEDQADMAVIAEASDGQTSVQLARDMMPDVIIMDVNLPGLNGIDATREIKRERPNSVVIGLSMHEDERMAEAMRQAGASMFLSKGSLPQALCAAIRAAQNLHHYY
jgi:signal transduction histidine kinase/ActR/RegA family two-component response regulator